MAKKYRNSKVNRNLRRIDVSAIKKLLCFLCILPIFKANKSKPSRRFVPFSMISTGEEGRRKEGNRPSANYFTVCHYSLFLKMRSKSLLCEMLWKILDNEATIGLDMRPV